VINRYDILGALTFLAFGVLFIIACLLGRKRECSLCGGDGRNPWGGKCQVCGGKGKI
jgi:DnaJ-class molecular chaperone